MFPVITDIVTRCFDAALTVRIACFSQALSYTAFDVQILKIVCTKLASKIQMMIFNKTAILITIHTIDSGVNFETRNLIGAKKPHKL